MTCGTCTHKDNTTPANMIALGFVRCQFVPLGGIFGSVVNRECKDYKEVISSTSVAVIKGREGK